MVDHKKQVFNELEDIRQENAKDINQHFKKLGYSEIVDIEKLRADPYFYGHHHYNKGKRLHPYERYYY